MSTTTRQVSLILRNLRSELGELIELEREATERFRSESEYPTGWPLLTASATTLSDSFSRLFGAWTGVSINFDRVLLDAGESEKCVNSLKTLSNQKAQALSHLLDAANSAAHAATHMASAHTGHPSTLMHRFYVEDNIADAIDSLKLTVAGVAAMSRLAAVMALRSVVADSMRVAA
ncbi:MAG TPA: hypothetical protein PKC18_20585 [Lacipirellulaceae bacterium]|nr:hypothetical protein [Lacipirellulaceae bacterium]